MADSPGPVGPFFNKACVVTGAGSGIGRALALELASRGARLAISDINPQTVAQTAERISAGGTEVQYYTLDVSDRDALFAHAAAVSERFSGVDVLINNAGVGLGADVSEIKIEDFRWLMEINFWGVVNGTQAFLPQLIAAKGRLVNIASVFGLIGVPGQSAYNAAKFAVRGFSEALRQEMQLSATGVKVTVVLPGGVRTNIARDARTYTDETPEERDRIFSKIARTSPEKAARVILDGAAAGDARVLVGADARMIDTLVRLLGPRYEKLTSRLASLTPR